MSDHTEDAITAHHEAAHAVVLYRTAGHVGGRTTIVPNEERHTLGHALDGVSDSFDRDHIEGKILSCYAGGHAQRRLHPASGDEGCGADDLQTADWLERSGWEDREDEFRERSRVLVEQHWQEIEAVAADLLRFRTLDDVEVETIADIAAGAPDVTPADLARYRATFAAQLARDLPGRR